MTAEAAWKMRGSLDAMGEQEAVDVLKGSPWRNSNRASNRGTSIHDYLDAIAQGRTVPKLEGDALRYKPAADEFLETYQPKFVMTEFTVFGDGYAGTCDFIAEIGGRLVIGDFKTSKALYPEIALQLAAARYADVIVQPDGTETPMVEVDGGVGVLITPDGCDVREVDVSLPVYLAFLACRDVWTFRNGPNPVGAAVTP